MRKAETTPKRLLLLPLIPALAFGLAAYVDHVSTAPPAIRLVEVVETQPAPVDPIVIVAPERTPDNECRGCVLSL